VTEDKYVLANWYVEYLGFKIVEDLEKLGEVQGPLVISGDEGQTGLALFNKKDRHSSVGTNVIPAFEVSPEEFVRLFQKSMTDSKLVMFDHLIFFSFYLKDSDGSPVEITSKKYQEVKERLEREGIPFEPMLPPS
tara:strand:- start:134 stop:538 length:405 start_codon:yes stop_codon:yes gene_type:complete